MYGLDALHRINSQRHEEVVVAAETKAKQAEQQGHPKAAEFKAQAEELRKAS